MVLILASLKTLWSLQNLIFDILFKPKPLQAFSKAIRKSQVLGERAGTGGRKKGEHKEMPESHKDKPGSHKESKLRKHTVPIYGEISNIRREPMSI